MVFLYIFLTLEALLIVWQGLDLLKARKEIEHLTDVLADDYAELWEDNDQVRDVLARYSKVLAEHETAIQALKDRQKENEEIYTDVCGELSEKVDALTEQQEETKIKLAKVNDWVDKNFLVTARVNEVNDRISGIERGGDMHAQQILDLYDKLSAIPVEEMQANAKKEEAFFQGVQNILDYSPEAVAHLNIGGVTHE